jgi:hypothetical protein
MVDEHHDYRKAEGTGMPSGPKTAELMNCFEGEPSGKPMRGRHDLERVSPRDLGEGYLVPKGGGKKHVILLYERRHPERDEGITVRFFGRDDKRNTQGEGNTL